MFRFTQHQSKSPSVQKSISLLTMGLGDYGTTGLQSEVAHVDA